MALSETVTQHLDPSHICVISIPQNLLYTNTCKCARTHTHTEAHKTKRCTRNIDNVFGEEKETSELCRLNVNHYLFSFCVSVFTLADPRTTHGLALICLTLAWVQRLLYFLSLVIRELQPLWNLLSSFFLSF